MASLVSLGGVYAEMQRTTITVTGATDAAPVVLGSLDARGLLYRLTVTVGGGLAKTNSLILADTDGAVVLSNSFTTGTTTTNFATPIPFVGLTISGFGANTNIVTDTVTTTNLR